MGEFGGRRMKALVFEDGNSLKMREAIKPEIKEDSDVLIRIKATGICGTDIHILRKEYSAKSGIILGHESSGIVEAVGSKVENVKVGDNVILDPTYHCGICFYCQNNRPNYCNEKGHTETGVSSNGTFAEYHIVNSAFLYKKPEEISFEVATLSEPLACVLNALRQTRISHESRVLVIGAGPIGLLFGLASTNIGCEVTIGEISDYRLEKAKELFSDVQNYSKYDILSLNHQKKYDIIIDTSGVLFGELLELIDKGGDILIIGLNYDFEAKIKPSYLTDNGIRIIGSIDSNLTFAPAIKMLKDNREFDKIITHKFFSKDYEEAFDVLGFNLKTNQRKEIEGGKVIINF
jgi:threonine dehydrogenase-like Zn-dependent dehydrogenase